MALYETLIEGGHEHLIDAVKARIAQKANAIVEDELKPIIENQPSATLEGELLVAEDAADLPPVMVHAVGRSEQVTTTGKNLFDNTNTPLGYYNASDGVFVSNNNYSWWSVSVAEGDVVRYTNCPDCIMTYYLDGAFVGHGAQTLTATYNVPAGVDEVRGYCASRSWSTGIVTKNNADLTYEPYTGGKPSPNPDYPQPIESVEQLALLMSQNPGMMLENGGFDGSGRNTTANYKVRVRSHGYMPVSDGETLAIDTGVSAYRTSLSYYTTNENNPARMGYEQFTATPVTFTVPSGASYARILLAGYPNDMNITPQNFANLTVQSSLHGTYSIVTVPNILLEGYALRSLPDGTKDTLSLTYLRPSTREGWAWYSRELVQKLTATDMQDLSITKSGNFYRVTQANMKLATGNGQWILMCECLGYNNSVTKGWFESYEVDNTIRPIYGQSFKAYIRADAYTTVADLKAALAGNEVVYKLATPVTIQLDPIELPVLPAPNCTVWADPTANLKLTYVIDSETIEESLESGIGKAFSSVAPVETSPATDNHDVGSRIVYNETLYKVTSAIAAGEDIVPGTNVTATTVAAELLATQA